MGVFVGVAQDKPLKWSCEEGAGGGCRGVAECRGREELTSSGRREPRQQSFRPGTLEAPGERSMSGVLWGSLVAPHQPPHLPAASLGGFLGARSQHVRACPPMIL